MDATATWKKGLSFTGTGGTSGFTLPMGASAKVGGEDDGFRPAELVLVALAGCTAMDVISILSKKRQEVTSFEVRTHGETAKDEPKRFTSFMIEYIVTGKGIDRKAVEHAVELSKTKYCTVSNTLAHAGPVEHRITIQEG